VVKAQISRMDGLSAHADQAELLHWLSCSGKNAEQIILVHGELDSQAAFSEKVQETFGIVPLIPQLGETIEFMPEQIIRHEPQKIWLTQNAAIIQDSEESEKKVTQSTQSTPQPIAPSSKRSKISYPRVSRAQVNRAYIRLRHHIKRILDEGQRTRDFERVINILNSMTRWLEEQERERRR